MHRLIFIRIIRRNDVGTDDIDAGRFGIRNVYRHFLSVIVVRRSISQLGCPDAVDCKKSVIYAHDVGVVGRDDEIANASHRFDLFDYTADFCRNNAVSKRRVAVILKDDIRRRFKGFVFNNRDCRICFFVILFERCGDGCRAGFQREKHVLMNLNDAFVLHRVRCGGSIQLSLVQICNRRRADF